MGKKKADTFDSLFGGGSSAWFDEPKKKKKKKDKKKDSYDGKDKKKSKEKKHKDDEVSKSYAYKDFYHQAPSGVYKVVETALDSEPTEIYIVKRNGDFPREISTQQNYKDYISDVVNSLKRKGKIDEDMNPNRVFYSSRVVPVKMDNTLARLISDLVFVSSESPSDDDEE